MLKSTSIWLVFISLPFWVFAGEWAQWRGPNQNGSTDEKNLPGVLSLTENLAWSVALPGRSSGTPIISKGKVFVSSIKKDSKDLLALCIDAGTGAILWEKKLAEAETPHVRNTQASPSPAADGTTVVFLYANGSCSAADYAGTILWQVNIADDIGPLCVKFGYSSSPLIYDDKVYIPVLRRKEPLPPLKSDKPLDSYLVALDIKTGKTVFKYIRENKAQDESQDSYITPMLFDQNGQKQILLWAADYMSGHNPATGEEIWRYDYMDTTNTQSRTVPMPVVLDNLICYVRPRGKDVMAFEPGAKGVLPQDCRKWLFSQTGPDCSSPLLYKGLLYFINDRGDKSLYCMEPKTGKLIWKEQLTADGPIFASPTGADEKIYILDESGRVTIVAAGGDKMNVLSILQLGGSPAYSTVAVAEGSLFIRTAEKLYCFRNK